MDPTLKRFDGAERGAPSPKLTFLVGGVIIIGAIAHPSRLEDGLTARLDAIAAEQADEGDAAKLRGYAFNSEIDKHDESGAFLTLVEVGLIFSSGQTLEVPVVRIRAERISAWWPVAAHPDESEGEADEEEVDDEHGEPPLSFGVE